MRKAAKKADHYLTHASPTRTGFRVGVAYSAARGVRVGRGYRRHKTTGKITRGGVGFAVYPGSVKGGFAVGASTAAGIKAYQVGKRRYGKTHSSTGKR